MLSTKLLAAGIAGAAFGAGTLALAPALASDGSSSSSATASHANGHAAHAGRRAGVGRLRAVIHADWTTRNKVHHEAIRGTVTAVSPSAITVRALDGVTETYAVTSATKVRVAGSGSTGTGSTGTGSTASIGDVKVGDRALVVGKDAHQATHVVARAPKSTSGSGTTQG